MKNGHGNKKSTRNTLESYEKTKVEGMNSKCETERKVTPNEINEINEKSEIEPLTPWSPLSEKMEIKLGSSYLMNEFLTKSNIK